MNTHVNIDFLDLFCISLFIYVYTGEAGSMTHEYL